MGILISNVEIKFEPMLLEYNMLEGISTHMKVKNHMSREFEKKSLQY